MRFYEFEGARLPSVTTVLSALPEPEALRQWREQTPDAEGIFRRRATVGTMLHYRIAAQIAKERSWPPPSLDLDSESIPPEAATALPVMWESWTDWRRKHSPAWLAAERVVVNREKGYAGRFDLFGILRFPVIVDIKTSRSMAGLAKWQAQVAAYRHCAPPPGVRREWEQASGAVLRIHEDTPWEFVFLNLADGWKLFEEALALWKENQR